MTEALAWCRRNWVLLAGIALIVGSDYKFRARDTTAAISGSLDVFILIELGLYAAVGLYVVATWVRPGRLVQQPEIVLLGFYVLLIILSLARTPYPSFAGARVVEMVILGLLALAVATRADRADLHRLAHGYLVLVAGSVVLGLVVPSTPLSNLQVGRFTWLAIHPTSAGTLLCIATVIGFGYATVRDDRPGPRWNRWVYAALLVTVLLGLLGTQTRAAVLGAVAGAMALQFAHQRGRRRLEVIAVSGLGLVLVALTAVPTIEAYFARGESVERLRTLNSRTDLWSVAWEAILRQPLYGHGVGASQGIFQEELGLGGAHNAAINVAVDLGFVGFAVWLALVLAVAAGVLRLPRTGPDAPGVDRSLLVGLWVAIQVDGLFTSGPGGVANAAATWLFLIVGWLVCVRRSVARTAAAQATPRAWV